jgi:pyruvate ferredoxin oxidoreductase gamma subunit
LIEIRIHGRGGQGAVLAAELMVRAAFGDGKYGQAFPAFGGERRGAPVQAFVRLDTQPVRVRHRVDHPHYVLILDRTLPNMVDVLSGLRDGGLALIDSAGSVTALAWSTNARVYPIPATSIAMQVFGQPYINPAMLGAFAGITGEVSLRAIRKAFKDRFPGPLGEQNSKAVQKGYEYARRPATKPVTVERTEYIVGAIPIWEGSPELGAPGRGLHFGLVAAPRTSVAYPTGSWRYTRPVVDLEACNGCGQCALFCPDASVRIVNQYAAVDYAYCKGCGICYRVCARDAIVMVAEEG